MPTASCCTAIPRLRRANSGMAQARQDTLDPEERPKREMWRGLRVDRGTPEENPASGVSLEVVLRRGLNCFSFELSFSLGPDNLRDFTAHPQSLHIISIDVIAAQNARLASHFRAYRERRQIKSSLCLEARLGHFARAADEFSPIFIATREEPKSFGAGRANRAMTRDISGKGRRDKAGRSVWKPILTFQGNRAFAGAAPPPKDLTLEIIMGEGPRPG